MRVGDTTHPYAANGTTSLYAGWPSWTSGFKMAYRFQADVLDSEGPIGSPADGVEMVQQYVVQNRVGGPHRGRTWTPWVQADGGYMQLRFVSNARNCPPEGCLPDGGLPDGGNWPYYGASVVSMEKAERQVGARAFDIPLRFPGQYFDAETEKHENWNRYYEPATGRYLSPEPLLQWPAYVGTMAEFGSVLPTYAYAGNNPIRNTDPTGLETKNPYGGGCHRGFDDHCAAPEGCTPQRITVKGSENPGHAMTVPRAYAYCRQKGARGTKFVIYERDTAGTTGDWLVDCYTCVIRNVCAPSMPSLVGPSSGAP